MRIGAREHLKISTHTLRKEGDEFTVTQTMRDIISTHTLRKEGD